MKQLPESINTNFFGHILYIFLLESVKCIPSLTYRTTSGLDPLFLISYTIIAFKQLLLPLN